MVRLLSRGVYPLAVVTRDASNPSTGLSAEQQVTGAERFERPSSVLETERLTIVLNPYEASPVPTRYVTGHRETDYTHMYTKLTLYLTLLYV